MITRQHWQTKEKDIKKGDLVIVKTVKQVCGKWQLAIVDQAIPGKDGGVSDVILKYKNLKDGK